MDTFENMVTEKPQALALKRFMPQTQHVGFQHYAALPPLHLCLFTTPTEARFSPLPDVIIGNSRFTTRQLADAGFPSQRLRLGPSLRYPHLAAGRGQRQVEGEGVLVVLPLERNACEELLHKLLAAFPQPESTHFWLKPHPFMPAAVLRDCLAGARPGDHMQVIDGPMGDWLPRAACAVTLASTSAVEIALAAVPLAVVGRETDLDVNPLACFAEFPPPVHAASQLRERLLRLLGDGRRSRDQALAWAQRMLPELYSPVDDATMSAFASGLPPLEPAHAAA